MDREEGVADADGEMIDIARREYVERIRSGHMDESDSKAEKKGINSTQTRKRKRQMDHIH